MVSLNTNLADLPSSVSPALSACLSSNDLWLKIIDGDNRSNFYLSQEDLEKQKRLPLPAQSVLRLWGNRGITVLDLFQRLQELSTYYGSVMDPPQLLLRRKFKPLKWGRPEEVQITVVNNGKEIALRSAAVGFPCPVFEWYKDMQKMENANSNLLLVRRCQCYANAEFSCIAMNEVNEGEDYSSFYRKGNKQFKSELRSDPISIKEHIDDSMKCSVCQHDEKLIASDKVALIISNCVYKELPELLTPRCDAETLAGALQELKFKTVTLADLTLSEMKMMVRQYTKLLGTGVYAVFYFVGHGFEVNGQCYLLPVDAPKEPHHPDNCLSLDWILAEFAPFNPSLNLLLLDVCRKYIPIDCVGPFIQYADKFKYKKRPNRNTVYGFSTSDGIGAYEIRGDVNGVFMKYLKNHVKKNISVVEMMNHVLRDIEEDSKVRDYQVPELRSTVTRPRSLADPLVYSGHTISFTHHTGHWRLMHELPTPVTVNFYEHELSVTIWVGFCGHFTNLAYVFSSVGEIVKENEEQVERRLSQKALDHRAFLRFPAELLTSNQREFEHEEEGVTICCMLSHLQRCEGPVKCKIELKNKNNLTEIVEEAEAVLGHVLITKIQLVT
ncbi:unnamed protein product [Auanema sp. JU1783]|nr:unnamed protein product [Auanema sp. JU1783]